MDISLVIGNGLLLLFVIIEISVLILVKKEPIPWKEVIFNINSGHILLWIFRGLEIAGYFLILQHLTFGIVDVLPYWGQWLVCFVLWDFCFYWLHRLHHKYPLLWAVHVIHHEGEDYNLSLGIRNSWYSSITSFPFFIVLALLGFPVEIFIATSSIHYFVQFYNHNRLVAKSGYLEKLLVTPSHHRVHHGCNDEYIDRNFGGTFVIWDKLFGTFQPERDDIEIVYGTKEHTKTTNVALANNIPLLKLFGFKVPKISDVNKYEVNDLLLAFGGLILFGMLLFYISIEDVWSSDAKAFYFFLIFIGTVANGGLSEGANWGLYLWLVFGIFINWIFLFGFNMADPILLFLFGMMLIHSLLIFFYRRPVQLGT